MQINFLLTLLKWDLVRGTYCLEGINPHLAHEDEFILNHLKVAITSFTETVN